MHSWRALRCLLAGCSKQPERAPVATPKPTALVDAARLTAPADGEWLSYGRTYDEQRFSPLDRIDVGQRGAARPRLELRPRHRASRAGIDAAGDRRRHVRHQRLEQVVCAGREDRQGDLALRSQGAGRSGRQGLLRRGAIAVSRPGTARSSSARSTDVCVAVDAATGKQVWEVDDGSGGSELHHHRRAARVRRQGAHRQRRRRARRAWLCHGLRRGDAASKLWRFYTVPGDPAQPFENAALEKAAKTWKGQWWKFGGGGTVWDSIVYDPKLDSSTSASVTAARGTRSCAARAAATTCILSSIVALKADTGEYVWHFQTTPGETWDYTATQPMMLADLEIGGKPRQVIMQAPKNGFFYVHRSRHRRVHLRRRVRLHDLGQAASIRRPAGRRKTRKRATTRAANPRSVVPGPGGAHSWQPDELQPDDRAGVFPGDGSAALSFIPAVNGDDQQHRLEHRRGLQRRQPAARSQGARRHQGAAQGTPGRLGSRRAEGSLARAVRTSVEWRHAGDRGQPRVPRQLPG